MPFTLEWVPGDVVAALRGDHQLGVFFRLDTEPPLRWWLGVGDIPASIDGVDADGTVYLGGGQLLGVPTLETLINGTSDEVEFTLSGVNVAEGTQALADLPPPRGKAISIAITTLDAYYQPMSAPIPLWRGRASHVTKSIPVTVAGSPRSVTLGLKAAGGNNTRSRPARVFWTNAHHQAAFPTDLFCSGTPRLGRGVQPSFPRF